RGVEYRRTAHHHRARVIGAVAVADDAGRAVKDVADALDRHFQRVGSDLRIDRLDALPDRRGPHIDRDGAVVVDLEPRAFLRAGGAAFDEAGHADAVILAVDQLAA